MMVSYSQHAMITERYSYGLGEKITFVYGSMPTIIILHLLLPLPPPFSSNHKLFNEKCQMRSVINQSDVATSRVKSLQA